MMLERTRFRKEWKSIVFFSILVTVPTFWVILRPGTRLQEIIGTIVASAIIGWVGWWFLRREGVPVEDVGLGRRTWVEGLVLFAAWWAVVTLVDVIGSGVASLLGHSLSPMEPLPWSVETGLDWAKAWIAVGFGEEIAFRGYLHNKLVKVLERRWQGILLAALLFGLWHIPGSVLLRGNTIGGLLAGAAFFGLLSLLVLNLPYEWTGLLPFVALFHGWNDFPLVATMRRPTVVGAVSGYVLLFVALWAYSRFKAREKGALPR